MSTTRGLETRAGAGVRSHQPCSPTKRRARRVIRMTSPRRGRAGPGSASVQPLRNRDRSIMISSYSARAPNFSQTLRGLGQFASPHQLSSRLAAGPLSSKCHVLGRPRRSTYVQVRLAPRAPSGVAVRAEGPARGEYRVDLARNLTQYLRRVFAGDFAT